MWTRSLAVLFALGLITGAATFGPTPAWADNDLEDHGTLIFHTPYGGIIIRRTERFGSRDGGEFPLPFAVAGGQAASVRATAAVFRLTNRTLTNGLQPGEPTEGGLMTKTVWAGFKAPAAERIVIHTYGSTNDIDGSSALDTVLAVYRGTTFANFARIAGNDNRPLPGISTKHSLVQFNTLADAEYRVQIGSRAQAEGDISLNVFSFPPTGGLSALMIEYADNPFNSRDYACETTTTATGILFCDAKFIVHNSTGQTLTVTPSTTLGPGVRGPAPFSLAPGALKVAEFTVDASFYRTVRTVSGHFVFTGRTGGKVVSEARHRALIVVAPSGGRLEDLIKAEVTPTVRTGSVNEPLAFTAKLTNRGGVTAVGCHFRSRLYSDVKTTFYRIHPTTGARLGADNRPSDIAPGESLTFKVNIASQRARDADPIDPEAIAECANSTRRQFSLRSGLDISVSGFFAPPPSLSLTSSVPANGVLTVPRSGFAYYTFRVKNTETTKSLDVLPAYVGPFDDPANSNYPTQICRTNLSNGKCIGNYASSVTYNAVKETVFGFSVRVKAPQIATPFDADKRRVYVNFKQTEAPYFHISAPSVAVKRQ